MLEDYLSLVLYLYNITVQIRKYVSYENKQSGTAAAGAVALLVSVNLKWLAPTL